MCVVHNGRFDDQELGDMTTNGVGTRRISRRFYRLENLDDQLDKGQRAADENRWVFEVSWETCNKGLCILQSKGLAN